MDNQECASRSAPAAPSDRQPQETAQQHSLPDRDSNDEPSSSEPKQSAFECNICYEVSRDPVVTFCGHLFCWPCLYRWLQVSSSCKSCPVCKAGVDHDKVIPIYGRGGDNQDPRKKAVKDDRSHTAASVPRRPAGRRPALIQRPSFGNPANFNMQQGLGYLFGMQQTSGLINHLLQRAAISPLFTLRGLAPSSGASSAVVQSKLPDDALSSIIHSSPTVPSTFFTRQSVGGFGEPLTHEQQHQAVLSRLLLMLGSLVIMCLLLF